MRIVLISTYELGRQPFGLASPAAWLREQGFEVACLDLSRQSLHDDAVKSADLVAFFVPMHTATRLAIEALAVVRRMNSSAHICFYGLYAPVNEAYLRTLGVQTILGGEFEGGLASLAARLQSLCSAPLQGGNAGLKPGATQPLASPQTEPSISLERLQFRVPDRSGLLPLKQYAHVILPDGKHRIAGYTEASRGCKHLCRHCPVVPVYKGTFRIVQRDVVLEDICRQVDAGAQHITFGDPDFFNGIGHALALVEEFHARFPAISYDITAKVEHLLKYANHLRTLRETGCLLVTTAVESVDDAILTRLDKGHTRADFVAVTELFRESGLTLHPTFVPFTPWTTAQGYCDLLETIAELRLVENVAPIQLAIRLLIPAGSRLLELAEVREMIQPFDEKALAYPWKHADPQVERLATEVQDMVRRGEQVHRTRAQIFSLIWQVAHSAAGLLERTEPPEQVLLARAAIPYLNEPWYC